MTHLDVSRTTPTSSPLARLAARWGGNVAQHVYGSRRQRISASFGLCAKSAGRHRVRAAAQRGTSRKNSASPTSVVAIDTGRKIYLRCFATLITVLSWYTAWASGDFIAHANVRRRSTCAMRRARRRLNNLFSSVHCRHRRMSNPDHLRAPRQLTADTLRDAGVPVTELRADHRRRSSAAFEVMRVTWFTTCQYAHAAARCARAPRPSP